MNSSLRFLFISHTAGLGGAEIAMVETMRGLQAAGHHVYAVLPNESVLGERLFANHLPYSIIRHNQWTGYGRLKKLSMLLFQRGYFISVFKIARLARKLASQIIVTNTSTIPAGAFAAKLAGIKHIWHLHEFVEEDHNLQWYFGAGFSYKLIAKLSDAVVCTSNAVKHKAQRLMPPGTVIKTIYCACEIEPAKPILHPLHAPARLLMAGSVAPGKNQLEAINALGLLENRGIEVQLILIGHINESYKTTIRQAIEALAKQERVVFKNFEADMVSVYNEVDIVLMTSKMEAFGRVLVEAQKRGLPCIGADSGGIPEILGQGRGVLYKAGDVEDLAVKIEQLISNHKLRYQIASKGFEEAVANYGECQNASAFAALAEEVLA